MPHVGTPVESQRKRRAQGHQCEPGPKTLRTRASKHFVTHGFRLDSGEFSHAHVRSRVCQEEKGTWFKKKRTCACPWGKFLMVALRGRSCIYQRFTLR